MTEPDRDPGLSVNAMAVLGLLATAPMTAYAIAEQVQHRALAYVWTSSRSLLLRQPRQLADQGLAEALSASEDSRAAHRWSATDRGRAVLRAWLGTDVRPTQTASEIGLRIVFADQVDIETTRRQLMLRRAQLTIQVREGLDFVDDYLATGGPFPARLHIVAAMMALINQQVMGELRGIEAVLAQLDGWRSSTKAPSRITRAELRAERARLVAELSRLDSNPDIPDDEQN